MHTELKDEGRDKPFISKETLYIARMPPNARKRNTEHFFSHSLQKE